MSVRIDAGRVIAGKYELVRRLGRGSMGEVWVAYHRTLFEEVAIKLLGGSTDLGAYEDRPTAAARFRFEGQVAARLSRKTRHIVRVTDHGEDDGLAYLVMELLEGQTLESRLMRGGCMVPREAEDLLAQIERGLGEAHRAGVVHRDLKPSNVFLARGEDGESLVKILDFGIARATQTVRVAPAFSTGEGLVFGTPGYMSPEQAIPGSNLDERCDLWALSTIVYEVLSGELPISGWSTSELIGNLLAGRIVPIHERDPALPPELASFFATAFAREIDHRFRSGADLLHHFRAAVSPHPGWNGAAANARRGSTIGMTFPMRNRGLAVDKHRRRYRDRLVAVGTGVLALVALSAWAAARSVSRVLAREAASSPSVHAIVQFVPAPNASHGNEMPAVLAPSTTLATDETAAPSMPAAQGQPNYHLAARPPRSPTALPERVHPLGSEAARIAPPASSPPALGSSPPVPVLAPSALKPVDKSEVL